MTHDRREFLGTMLGGAGWALLGGCATFKSCQEAIANRPVRRNVASLGPNHPILAAYKSAITQMKALPSSDPRNWTRQAQIHNDFCPHGNWLFLPWHRAYLLYFERICRKLSGMADFALPYWNWSTTPSIPAPFWGGSTNPLFDANRTATAASVAADANIGPSVVGGILDEPNFLTFASGAIAATAPQRPTSPRMYGRLEGTPHNYVHGFVGGDMGGFMSPLDPIFWLHHNMIERCWVTWNFDNDHPNTNDRAWLDREFTEFCDDNGDPVRVSVATTLLFPVLSYRYDDVGPGAAGVAETQALRDRSARKAKAGARVRLDLVQQFRSREELAPVIGQPAALRIAVDAQILKDSRARGSRALLAFDGTSVGHTEDFSARVFVNKPDASVDTPPGDPHFAGAFAFFDHAAGGHDHGGGNFVIDVSDVLRRLDISGGTIELDVVLVPYPGRQPKTRALTVTTTELRIVKDVVERSQ